MMLKDIMADGSKAERELGIAYTSIQQAVEDDPKEIQHPYMHRKYSRFSVSRKIMLRPGNMEHLVVRLREEGMFAETDKPIKEGMNVTEGFSERMESLPVVKGKVLRKTGSGVAVQFTGGGADNIPGLLSH